MLDKVIKTKKKKKLYCSRIIYETVCIDMTEKLGSVDARFH